MQAPSPHTHNQPDGPLTQKEMDDLFLIHLAQARKDNDELERAMEIVRAVKKLRKRNRNLAHTDGFILEELDNILADEQLPRSDVERREAMRSRMRGIANQPGGDLQQQDLFQRVADQTKMWEEHGYTCGLRGADQDPQVQGVPAELHQAWMAKYTEGQKRLGEAFLTKHKIDGTEPPKVEAEPETETETQAAAESDGEAEAEAYGEVEADDGDEDGSAGLTTGSAQ